ncbi:MAG: hypothetical protein ACOX9C_04695 [Kiritimatiellia bacterium]|jgi:hypothetical protein|uniref:hypothetical protein n=1 Tax=Atribacter sp. TaxID=2847780 RepID=UPI003D966513
MKRMVGLMVFFVSLVAVAAQANSLSGGGGKKPVVFALQGSKQVGAIAVDTMADRVVGITAQHVAPDGIMSNVVVDAYGIAASGDKGFWLQDGNDIVLRILPPVRAVNMPVTVDFGEIQMNAQPRNAFDVRFAPSTAFRMICCFGQEQGGELCVLATGMASSVENNALTGTNVVVRWSGSGDNAASFGGGCRVTPADVAEKVSQAVKVQERIGLSK